MNEKSILVNTDIPINTKLINSIQNIDRLFSDNLHVKVLDHVASDAAKPWKSVVYEDSSRFMEEISQVSENTRLRIVSFHSPSTSLPLKASIECFQTLSRAYNINPGFNETLAAFGRFPDPANGFITIPVVSKEPTSESFECWYRLHYVEKNNRNPTNPWSIRHTGIYHQYCEEKDFHLVVLVHPCRNTVLETLLFDETSQNSRSIRDRLIANPINIHEILCDVYLPNWSPYIGEKSKAQERTNDDVQTCDLKIGSLDNDFALTQQLCFMKNTAMTDRIICRDNVSLLNELDKLFHSTAPAQQQWLKTNQAKALARCESLHLLQERIQNDIELLEHTAAQRDSRLNHRNQTVATKLNETLLDLTYNTVDDSATIKVITILSLIFLPGSFIATMFGMNFFYFDYAGPNSGPSNIGNGSSSGGGTNPSQSNTTEKLINASNLWVFIATWLPITFLVLSIYIGVVWRRKKVMHERRAQMKALQESGEDVV